MEKNLNTDLVIQAQQGSSEAMNALFAQYYNDVYFFARKTVQDEDLACDITQETFLEVIRTIGKLQAPEAFVTWLRQITYHQCTRYFRKKKEVLVEEDEDGSTIFDTLADESEGSIPAEVYEQAQFRQTIGAMLDDLSEAQRSAIVLYYFDELSVAQIAGIQGVSEGTVKSRLNYARKAIKKSVEDYEKKHDIKLHSFSLLPLLLFFFGKEVMPPAKAQAAAAAVSQAAAAAGNIKAAAAKSGLLAKLRGLSLGTKLVAGVTSLAILGGGIFAATGGFGHQCKDRDDDRRCDICGETLGKKVPATGDSKPRPTTSAPEAGSSRPTEPEHSGPQYVSDSLFAYEVSWQILGNIQNIHCFSHISLETGDGRVYDLQGNGGPSITVDGSGFFRFYNCYGYTDSQGRLCIGQVWGAPRFIAEDGIGGQILYCAIPGYMDQEGAYVYTLEEGRLYCSEIAQDGTVTKVSITLYIDPEESGDSGALEWDSFVRAEVICGNALGFTAEGIQPMLYAETADGRQLTASLTYAPYAEDALRLWANPCRTPSANSRILAYAAGTLQNPLCYESRQDTALRCVNQDWSVSTFRLPEGYTAANIAQVFFGKQVVILLDDGSICSAQNTFTQQETALVVDEALSHLNREGHILRILDSRDVFVFLADDGFLYGKAL